jgi:hypothetical protein
MKIYAIVENGFIVNTIIWNGTSEYAHNGTAVEIDSLYPIPGIGWTYDGSTFINPNPSTPPSDGETPGS